MTKRVLVLAHPFPPAGGGGVQRTTKLVKYLSDFGWQPTVMTTQADLYPRLHGMRDDTLLEEVPKSVEVVRVPSPEVITVPKNRWLQRLRGRLAQPEPARLWNITAFPAALALQVERRFDVLYATGNPYSTYLLARALSRAARVPYVVDMRDAWLQWEKRAKGPPKLEARYVVLERKMLLDASAVVFVTTPMEAQHLRAYPELEGRTEVILNGFDHADFESRAHPGPRHGPEDPVVFLHSGVINWYIRPDCLYDAFQIARARDEAFRRRARLRLVGKVGTTEKERAEFKLAAESRGLDGVLEDLGYRPHPETVMLQRTADVLILITSGLPDEQHGKTAEYLAAGRPIFGLIVEGTPADQLISLAPSVAKARPDDREAAAEGLLRLFRGADAARPPDPLPPSRPDLYRFTRKAAAEQMAGVFQRVSATGRR
jgi:glycosyltransferase involved in cell wall biosynthesis